MKCDKCNGTGEIPDPNDELTIGGFCPASIQLWGKTSYDGDHLTCIRKGLHPNRPHFSIMAPPCEHCLGMDMHTDLCPNSEYTTNDIITVLFDDDGWYWVDTEGTRANL